MDKFICKKTGKIFLTVQDDGTEKWKKENLKIFIDQKKEAKEKDDDTDAADI